MIITDQQTEGLAAGHAKFFFVNLAEEVALIEFDRALQVSAQFCPAKVEHSDLDP
jgi:hypothetical protein